MGNPAAPLLIILGTVALLTVIQYLLTSPGLAFSGRKPKAGKDTTPDLPENTLYEGFTLSNLDSRAMHKLRHLVTATDPLELTSFLAFHDCHVVELDKYLASVRDFVMEHLTKNDIPIDQVNFEHLLNMESMPIPPEGVRLELLEDKELKDLLDFSSKGKRLLNREFMSRFGGVNFHLYFHEYATSDKSVTLHIPPDHSKRMIFEHLAESGIAVKGRDIHLAQRLTVLTMAQLQQVAKDLNIKQEFTDQAEAIAVLGEHNGAKVSLSMIYAVDNLFMLNPVDVDEHLITSEWNYYYAYARLLMGVSAYLQSH